MFRVPSTVLLGLRLSVQFIILLKEQLLRFTLTESGRVSIVLITEGAAMVIPENIREEKADAPASP